MEIGNLPESSHAIFQTIAETDTDEMNGKYLTFWTDGQLFGVPIAHVVQIVGIQPITEMPEFPHYAKGIINLRGLIVPLIDVRLRLGRPEVTYNERTCIVVIDIDTRNIGFIVDEVDSVIVIDDNSISAPPHLSDDTEGYITGIGTLTNKVVLLMDTHKIMGAEKLVSFTNSQR